MSKLFLFLIILYLVYRLRRWLRPKPAQRATPGQPLPGKPEQIRSCAHCGVLVPESEGVRVQAEFFCSAEHARLGRS